MDILEIIQKLNKKFLKKVEFKEEYSPKMKYPIAGEGREDRVISFNNHSIYLKEDLGINKMENYTQDDYKMITSFIEKLID
jgi:hypothetical protein